MRANTSAIDELPSNLRQAFSQSSELSRRAALRATKDGHPVEAAIYAHIAARFLTELSLEGISEMLTEVTKLSLWLPTPPKHRGRTLLERKGLKIQFLRSLKTDPEIENVLISQATQSPGRPAETRLVAVTAMEMHNKGECWRDIERKLLPHRRDAKNPGETIRREVQLLKRILERYRVRLLG